MAYNIKKYFKNYINIEEMLSDIPEQLWDIFLPENSNVLHKLEIKIASQKRKEHERKQVMEIQRLHGFPLRPNAPIHEVMIKVKIHRYKLERQRRRKDSDK